MVIGHKWYVTNFASNYGTPNDIYLERGTYLGEVTPIFKRLRNRGVKLVSYDEEGGLNYRNFDEYANRYNFASYIDTFDAWLTWGPRDYSFFKLNTTVSNSSTNICDFGTPRSGLWNAESLNIKKNLTIANDSRPSILLATNFVYTNNIVQNPEKIFANVDKEIKDRIIQDLHFGKDRNIDELNYQRFREVIELTLKYTTLDILIRPHPVERESELSKKLVKESLSPRVKIDESRSLTEQLKRAKLLVHAGSTSSIEAAVYEVPSINLEKFLKTQESILQTSSDVFSLSPRSREEFIEVIQKWELKSPSENKHAIEDLVWLHSSLHFYEKFLQLLEKLVSSSDQRSKIKIVRTKGSILRIILDLLNLRVKNEKNMLDRTKRPNLTTRELEIELENVALLLGIENRFIVRKLDRSTYEIEFSK